MSRFLKYQFESQAAWETVKATISESREMPDGETSTAITVGTVVELGNLLVTPAVMDENDPMVVVSPAIYQSAYSVDILWNDDEAEGFEAYRIYCDPSTKAHTFYGLDELYEQEYNNQAS
jgi:hypothetical protein